MKNIVKMKSGQLDHFRKLARETPLEIMAYLIGEVKSPELTVIDSFAYTHTYAVQSNSLVGWSPAEYTRVSKQADELGKRIVGYIHSHPQWDAVMSPPDYDLCVQGGYRVCGIVSVYGRKTRARFWTIDSALPCEILYAKKTKRSEI